MGSDFIFRFFLIVIYATHLVNLENITLGGNCLRGKKFFGGRVARISYIVRSFWPDYRLLVPRFKYSVLLLAAMPLLSLPAHASDETSGLSSYFAGDLVFENPFTACTGTCGVHAFAGQFLDTSMATVWGLEGFKAPWDWTYGQSKMIGVAASRRLATAFGALSLVGEVGLAQRFGDRATASEIWGALYLRWHKFPWDDVLKTTVAVSTGLNFASKLDGIECVRFVTGNAKLLHYFSPEITFALPEKQDLELVLRLHHRSGGRDYGFGTSGIFNGTAGGAQYLTVGLRQYF